MYQVCSPPIILPEWRAGPNNSSIGERRVQRHNKRLGWLGSISAVGVFDSNDRDQTEQYLVLLGQARHPGRIIGGGPHTKSLNDFLYILFILYKLKFVVSITTSHFLSRGYLFWKANYYYIINISDSLICQQNIARTLVIYHSMYNYC